MLRPEIKEKFSLSAGNKYYNTSNLGIDAHTEHKKFWDQIICWYFGEGSYLSIQMTAGWFAIPTKNLNATAFDVSGIVMSGGTHQLIGREHLGWIEYAFRIVSIYRSIIEENEKAAEEHCCV